MELQAKDFSTRYPFIVNERVNPDGKDYGILFKMNGCGWCTKMEPVWEKLNRVIGFMRFYTFTIDESTENINQWHKIQKSLKTEMSGFPMVLLYGQKNKRVISYAGYKSFDEMKQKIIQFGQQV